MADLEKNLEQAIEEAMQPNSKAEKGAQPMQFMKLPL